MKSFVDSSLSVVALLVSASVVYAQAPYSGGETTRIIEKQQMHDRSAFSFPASNLSFTRSDNFFVGNSFFTNAWVTAPASAASRDGLGPIYNTNSCQSCHIRDGRGRPPRQGELMTSMLVRISLSEGISEAVQEKFEKHGSVPHPTYGGQIQTLAIEGVATEADVSLEWHETKHKYADGKSYSLRKPVIKLSDYGYGEITEDIHLSARVAPQMIGLGLLDAIDIKDLEKLADPDDMDNDGISGRLNSVWDRQSEEFVPGRFGWKASQPNIKQQVASAFAEDIGITSSLFPAQPCTEKQSKCSNMPTGGKPEVSDEILDFVTFYSKTLAVPGRRSFDNPFIIEGEKLFKQANCHACHVDTFITAEDPGFPELSKQEIHPYTDLLLHDMGEGLADGHREFSAEGREWRTPPLWGIGLVRRVNEHTNFLHDGRARNVAEAILWHGGEAEDAKQAFVNMSEEQRRKLLAFVNSL